MASTYVGPHCHTVCSLAEGQVTPLALAAWDSSNVNVIKMLNSHNEYKETLLTTHPDKGEISMALDYMWLKFQFRQKC